MNNSTRDLKCILW